ncbi:MAG: Na/Pi cotransporter family protein [Bacilli bacterium]|nr:Na/Pi cotransporter family protein [Bacilli bacterium]
MTIIEIITAILTLFTGIGIFLIACKMMSTNLEGLSGSKLRQMFSKTANKKLIGVGIGTIGTAAIQSSGATTVMTIGFVNAGIMTLTQAACVIFGANIGTTITGQIVALGLFNTNSVSTTIIFSAFTGIGAIFITFAKKDNLKKIGGIITGFGLLFVGLSLMSESMENFAQLDAIKIFLSSIDNMLLLIIIGALLTAIIQSSSVMTSICITMVVTGLITLNQGIYITMGANIGSCVVALIAGLTSKSANAKRASLIHLIFNVAGVIIFGVVGVIIEAASRNSISYGSIFELLFKGAPQLQLAMFHTIFNITTVIIVLPFTDLLVKLVTKLIPDKNDENKALKLHYVSDYLLKTPPIALRSVKNEIINMSKIAMDNFNLAIDVIVKLDLDKKETFDENETYLDFISKELIAFLVKIPFSSINEKDQKFLTSCYRTIADFERIGDYAENIIEDAQSLKDNNSSFSDEAIQEIYKLKEIVNIQYNEIIKSYKDKDLSNIDIINKNENEIDDLTDSMELNHIARLNIGKCTPVVGTQYLSLGTNVERIADHLFNISKAVKTIIE